jgi:hypothetical protein
MDLRPVLIMDDGYICADRTVVGKKAHSSDPRQQSVLLCNKSTMGQHDHSQRIGVVDTACIDDAIKCLSRFVPGAQVSRLRRKIQVFVSTLRD